MRRHPHHHRHRPRGRQRELLGAPRRNPRPAGRIRLRQVHDRDRACRPARAGGQGVGRFGQARRRRTVQRRPQEAPRDRGHRTGHRVPGRAHGPQSALHRGNPTGRAVPDPPGHERQGRQTQGCRTHGSRRDPAARVAAQLVPASVLRRYAPAPADRDGGRAQPQRADRRRTHHGARRHGSGADHGPAAGSAHRVPHGRRAHHARSGAGGRGGRPGRRDVRRADRRDRAGVRGFQ